MVQKKHRSGRYRKVKTKSIKSRSIHYKVKKSGRHKCSNCKVLLKGVPNFINSQHFKVAKSLRGPSRVFGGNLCVSCSRLEAFRRAKEMMENG